MSDYMGLEEKARILITGECNRNCSGCCNNYSNIMRNARHITNLADLPTSLGEIMLTGGEPMLFPPKTERITGKLRCRYPLSKIYLYSALYHDSLEIIIPKLDGLHYTIHEGATERDLNLLDKLQSLLQAHREDWSEKSFRLYIDNRVNLPVTVIPNIWRQVNISKWLTEKELLDKQPGGLPKGELLFIYTGD